MLTQDTWIDLSDLYAWKGHFSGIQRVVYMYAKYYQQQGAKLFIYESSEHKYVQVYSLLPETIETEDDGKKFRFFLKRIYTKLVPRFIRGYISPLLRRVQHILGLGLHQLQSLYVQKYENPSIFNNGDTVIIMGAGWESEGFSQSISDIKRLQSIKLIHLVHDVLPLTQPHLFDTALCQRFTNYMNTMLPLCDGLISVSKATLHEVESYALEEKIPLTKKKKVVRLGEDSYEDKTVRRPSDFTSKKPYILSVGTIEVRKNHVLLYNAYKLARSQGITLPDLVIVGRKGWLANDFYDVISIDRELKQTITLLQNVSDDELSWLYDNCLFTVYPSICEGWGLTISDSIGKGKLCLTSNVSSMPEVAGHSADYFNPFDARDCMEKIVMYSENTDALRKKEKAISQYSKTKWEDSFNDLREFTESV
ncbi:MAG: glycosyltransferase family 1 protein [Candidatus Saccharibacteria bacterium]|nr:glycosyltransferase family 1 protein [Candidatus Saccharibacteria bacterium]